MIKSNIFGRGREAISRNFFYIGIWCIIKTAFKWRLGNLHRQKQGRGHDGGFLGQIGSSWDDDDDGPGSGIVVVSGRCHHREKFWMKVEVFTLLDTSLVCFIMTRAFCFAAVRFRKINFRQKPNANLL